MTSNDSGDHTQPTIPTAEGGAAVAATTPEPSPEDRLALMVHQLTTDLVSDLQGIRATMPPQHPWSRLVENLAANLAPVRDLLTEALAEAGHLI